MTKELPLEVTVRVVIDGPKKGEVIIPEGKCHSDWDYEVANGSARYTLFASGSDIVECGFTRYRKVSDRSFCSHGPVRELKYEKVT